MLIFNVTLSFLVPKTSTTSIVAYSHGISNTVKLKLILNSESVLGSKIIFSAPREKSGIKGQPIEAVTGINSEALGDKE